MEHSIRVAAVVVTYNRLALLKECLSALYCQSYKNFDIIVVNNGSNDGTTEWLANEKGLVVLNQDNCGGAGGFYTGMKYMFEHNYDALWMMDDDGIADSYQLENLIDGALKYNLDYANALVVCKDNKTILSDGSSYNKLEIKDYIPKVVCPFNGTFIWKHVIEKVGMIKREMYIWGDEREYTARIEKVGFKIGTISSAIHYHPMFRGDVRLIIPFIKKGRLSFKPSPRDRIFFRNIGYIDRMYHPRKLFVKYIMYYLLRLKFKQVVYFNKYYKMGYNDDFTEIL